jgi:phosphoglycerate dehydrogenase-like enzyme
MRVLAYDPFQKETIEQTGGVGYRTLPDLLRQSDFITVHAALSEKTRHLIGERELSDHPVEGADCAPGGSLPTLGIRDLLKLGGQ